MGRKVDVEDLVGAYEIAARLGMKRTGVVYDWRRRHPDFPEPIVQLASINVWAWPDVVAWARRTGRLDNE